MSSRYTADGRRRSSMTHATRGEDCEFCGRRVYGNGGKVSHGRGHVRRGEAIEMLKEYPTYLFLDDEAALECARCLEHAIGATGTKPLVWAPQWGPV